MPTPDLQEPPVGRATGRLPKDSFRRHALLLGCFLIVLVCTRGYYLADTQDYAVDAAKASSSDPGRLWEFGHLFWRPLGSGFLAVGWPALGHATQLSPTLLVTAFFIAVSLVCAVLTVLLWHLLALEVHASAPAAFLAAFGFACASAFLTYAHSGTPYVPGLFCVTLAIWLVRRFGARAMWRAAALTALAALLWFPYVLSAPGVLFLLLWPAPAPLHAGDLIRSANVRLAVRFSLVFLLCLVLGYSFGAVERHIGSTMQFKQWIADSSHQWSQSSRVLRLATGVPRTFFYMGNDGILYKRFLRKDPYAPVTVAALARASLWKLALFGLFLLALVLSLHRTKTRWASLVLLTGVLPVLAFAVMLFEPGSPERYLPAYPFLLLAVVAALRESPGRLSRSVVAIFLALVCVNNVFSMNRWRLNRVDEDSIRRLLPLKQQLRTGSLVAILSNHDDLDEMCNRSPFAAVNRPTRLRLYDIVEPATFRVLTWRQEFAREALAAWNAGGDVWVTKRVWSQAPRPGWNWAEGDDPRISWRALPPVFTTLETDSATPGEDGFFRLSRSAANTAELVRLSALPTP